MFQKLFDKIITVQGNKPRDVAKTVIVLLIFGYFTGRFARSIFKFGLKKTFMKIGFRIWKTYQGKSGYKSQMKDVRNSIKKSLFHDAVCNTVVNNKLPQKSTPANKVLSLLKKWSLYEEEFWNGKKKVSSGAVYHGGKELTKLQNSAYSLFSIANPLHPDVFPFTRKLESEVIAMSISYFNGNPYKQKGLLTSGGTESICMAVRAYKNWAKKVKNISDPELIIPQSAHSAFTKACEMFGIKCVYIRPNQNTFIVEPNKVEKLINSNTIAIIASAPAYSQGVLDPIPELSKLAVKKQIGLHVDCCLGSFLMPTLANMGYDIPPFDFRCPGVTSISADTHKFGYTQKGTSVVMFRDNDLRRHAYFVHTESSIGIYCTPTIQGSRSGGLVASAWSCMMHMGEEGYQREAKIIMEAVEIIKKGVCNIDGIKLAGNPVMAVVGILSDSSSVEVYKVSDGMSQRGWTLNNCKDPPVLHICVTRANCTRVKERFVKDLQESVTDVIENPQNYVKSAGAIYGVMVNLPEIETQEDIMHEYLDVMLALQDED